MPGSAIALAHQRMGLPLPSMPDPATFTDEDWAAQGHEVRSCLTYAWVEDQLYVRVAWDDSWEPAAALAGLDQLRLMQQRLHEDGDTTDICAIAEQQQRQEAEEQAAAAAAADAAGRRTTTA